MNLSALHQAILKTISYADVFDYPLNLDQAHRYLIGERSSISQVKTGIAQLKSSGLIIIDPQTQLIALKNRQRLFSLRQSRSLISKKKAKVGELVGKWLAQFPTIEAVYLTGAVAMNNATKYDDIDLMIITKPNWLWPTRLLVTIALDLKKIRRKPEIKLHRGIIVKDKICPNLFMDSRHLSVPVMRRNLYTAHEVVQASAIFTKNHTSSLFLWSNRWITSYLPNINIPPKPARSQLQTQSPLPFFSYLNSFTYRLQKAYMKHRQTNELVTHHVAYFHPRPTSQIVLDSYHVRLSSLNIKP